MAIRTRRQVSGADTWAGFVDALSTLLVVLIFALVVFMLAQFFQGIALSGRDEALARLETQVAELADMLALERDSNASMRLELTQLSAELQRSTGARDDAEQALALLSAERDGLLARLTATENYAADTGSALDAAQTRLDLLQADERLDSEVDERLRVLRVDLLDLHMPVCMCSRPTCTSRSCHYREARPPSRTYTTSARPWTRRVCS